MSTLNRMVAESEINKILLEDKREPEAVSARAPDLWVSLASIAWVASCCSCNNVLNRQTSD